MNLDPLAPVDSQGEESIVPRFGTLVIACFAALIFSGVLVWLMAERFSDCCDLSWLGRFIH